MPSKRNTKKKSRERMPSMGRLLPPVDIRNTSQVNELNRRIMAGPLTLVFVYADWCGHCQTFKPKMNQLENINGRSVQVARIRDDMVPQSALANTEISGYPSVLLVKQDGSVAKFENQQGEVTNTVPEHNDMVKMATLVRNAGTPEGQAILNNSTVANSVMSPNLTVNKTPTPTAPVANATNIPASLNSSINLTASLKNRTPTQANLPNATPTPVTMPQSFNTNRVPKSIVADRLSNANVMSLNTQLVKSNNTSLRAASKPLGAQRQAGGGIHSGGGLWYHLAASTQALAPAAALFAVNELAFNYPKRKTRRVVRRSSRSRKN